MKVKNLFLIFLLFFLFVLPSISQAQNVGVGIQELKKGKIISFDFLPYVYIGNTTKIFVGFRNIGSLEFDEKIEILIKNTTGEVIADFFDISVHLLPGEERYFLVTFKPMGVGMHIIQVRVAYDGQLAQAWGAFYVIYPPVYQIIPKEVEVPIYYPVIKPTPPGIAKLGVDYQKEYFLSEGQSLLIPIIVKNLGNVSLHNMKISLSHESVLATDVFPKHLFELEPGKKSTFLISVIALNGSTGTRIIDFDVSADEAYFKGQVTLNISISITEEEIRQKILGNEFIISQVELEIEDLKRNKINTTKVEELLAEAKEKLLIARKLLEQGELTEAAKKIAEKDRLLEKIVTEIALLRIPKIVVVPPYFLILLIILIIIISILLAWYLRRKLKKKKEKRPEMLKRMEMT